MIPSKPKISFNTAPPSQPDEAPGTALRFDPTPPQKQAAPQAPPPERSAEHDRMLERARRMDFSGGPAAQDRDFEDFEGHDLPAGDAMRVAAPRRSLGHSLPARGGLSEGGFLAPPPPGFLARNAGLLGVGGLIAGTFILGLATAYVLFGDRRADAPQTALADETPDAVTRAVLSDLTDVRTPSSIAEAASLSRKADQALELLSKADLKTLRAEALAGTLQVVTDAVDGVERVRLRAAGTDLGRQDLVDRLIVAVEDGRIDMAPSLLTPQGAVDTDTMMFNLVQTALLRDETAASDTAARNMARMVFAASTARTQTLDGQRIYTVRAGDSLAYIALQFYGQPDAYVRILAANRNTLQSPDKIQEGQRLIIPG